MKTLLIIEAHSLGPNRLLQPEATTSEACMQLKLIGGKVLECLEHGNPPPKPPPLAQFAFCFAFSRSLLGG